MCVGYCVFPVFCVKGQTEIQNAIFQILYLVQEMSVKIVNGEATINSENSIIVQS